MGVREDVRSTYGFGTHDDKIATHQAARPGTPRFAPLYEAVKTRFPHFGYETEAVPRSKTGEQLVVRFRNYPVLLLDDGSMHCPPLVELAFNDRLRDAPELVSDPEMLARLRRSVALRRRARRPPPQPRFGAHRLSPHEYD